MVLVSLASVGFPYLVRTVLGLSAQLYGAAESAMGVAAFAGSAAVGLLAGSCGRGGCTGWWRRPGCACCRQGAAFLLPVGVMGRYLVLLAAFCGCQLAAGMFSICAVSLVQQRTPRHLTGKVMAFVYTIPLCAQPVGQLLCGALLDAFAGSVWLVLLPGGLLICAAAWPRQSSLRGWGGSAAQTAGDLSGRNTSQKPCFGGRPVRTLRKQGILFMHLHQGRAPAGSHPLQMVGHPLDQHVQRHGVFAALRDDQSPCACWLHKLLGASA